MKGCNVNRAVIGLVLMIATDCRADDRYQWAESMNEQAVGALKQGDVSQLPTYEGQPDHSRYQSNPQQLKTDATNQAQTDEAAQLIYGLGNRPPVQEQTWYKNANQITKDVNKVDDDPGEYSDCEVQTVPGDTTTTTRSCTESRLPTTQLCADAARVEVDSRYLYRCHETTDTQPAACVVGRAVDVEASHNYRCQLGVTSRYQACKDVLDIEYSPREEHPKKITHCNINSINIRPQNHSERTHQNEAKKAVKRKYGTQVSIDTNVYINKAWRDYDGLQTVQLWKSPNTCRFKMRLYMSWRGYLGTPMFTEFDRTGSMGEIKNCPIGTTASGNLCIKPGEQTEKWVNTCKIL